MGRFAFSFMILKLQTLTADISRNSVMYSNTFEIYDFNYVTNHELKPVSDSGTRYKRPRQNRISL